MTDKISSQVRTISIGMLVFVWSMLNAAPGTRIADAARSLIGGIGLVALFAVLALIADYLQYVLGYRVVGITRDNEEHQKTQVYKWPKELIVFKAQYWFFWAKQILCILGVLLVMVLVFVGFFS